MIQIVAGTDRPKSKTGEVAKLIHQMYQGLNVASELMDLSKFDSRDLMGGEYYEGPKGSLKMAVDKITTADGVVMVVPEYNGSYPGILKLFIDYWKYPDSFEARPMCFVGLGARWGGLRPVEHLQQVFGYRNAYMFPNRVFLTNIHAGLKDGALTDPLHMELLKVQAQDFSKFIAAIQSQGLDANSRLKNIKK